MDNPIISVIMPVYNGEIFLERAIESILNQTFTKFELIIINDGSTDASLLILEKYQETDNRVKIFSQNNRGLIFSLNKGIELAQGKYIARMDADDVSFRTRFFEQIKFLDKGYDIVGCHFLVIDEASRLIDSFVMPRTATSFLCVLSQGVPFAHGSVMFSKEFWDNHKLSYSNDYFKHAEDYMLWTRFFACDAKMASVDEFLFQYRCFGKSLSKENSNLNQMDTYKISKSFIRKNRELLCGIKHSEIGDFTPFEMEYFASTIFYLFLTFRFTGKVSIFKKIPLKVKLIAFFKSIKMVLSR